MTQHCQMSPDVGVSHTEHVKGLPHKHVSNQGLNTYIHKLEECVF